MFIKSFVNYMISGVYADALTFPTRQKEIEMPARLVSNDNQYELFANGELVATYSRARDAKRGAARRGLVLA